MDMPLNRLKRQLRQGVPQIGLWSSLASHITVEVISGAGFDWLLLDTEHSPNELPMLHQQIAAMARGTAEAVVRPAWNDAVVIKRILELGVQTLLIPMVQNAEEAQRAVAATRYPPQGIRGLGTVTRANDYGRVKNYLAHANDEICVIVQLETQTAIDNLEAIAAVEGVDGLFVGPSDLSADLGFLGQSNHAEVRRVIDATISRIVATGKFAGILTPDEAYNKHCLELGARFVAVGSDSGLLARQSEALAARFKNV
ncbi:4-hydroxy-2-oxoheptanedioate aldolase [soil metagenome]